MPLNDLFERAKPPKPASVNISFSLPAEEAKDFEALCMTAGVDRSDVLRRLVRDVMAEADRP